MRNIGDHSWLNEYIGRPYCLGGRGPESFDCYGICKLVYAEQYGIDLPDWSDDVLDLRGRAQAIADIVCSGFWEPLDEPIDGCFVVCARNRAAHHLGLYFAGGVLHSAEQSGQSIYEPLSRFKARYQNIEFGEWTP